MRHPVYAVCTTTHGHLVQRACTTRCLYAPSNSSAAPGNIIHDSFLGLYENHGDKLKKNHGTLFLNRQIHGEFTAAIHVHIVLIKHPNETVFHSANYAIFQSVTE